PAKTVPFAFSPAKLRKRRLAEWDPTVFRPLHSRIVAAVPRECPPAKLRYDETDNGFLRPLRSFPCRRSAHRRLLPPRHRVNRLRPFRAESALDSVASAPAPSATPVQ